MSAKITPEQAAAVIEGYELRRSVRGAADHAGVSFNTANRVLIAAEAKPTPDPDSDPDSESFSREEGETDGRVEFRTRKPIRTMADAVAHAGIDLTVWRVTSCKVTAGETAMKLRSFSGGKVAAERPETVPVWWITIKLERVMPRPERDALDGLFSLLARHAPAYHAPKILPPREPHLMVLDLVDCHFGKLAWAPETGQNYDLRIADRVYRDAVTDLLSRASAYDVDEYLIPLGSDFLHVDNAGGTTTAGTPQDVDGRLSKILETAEAAVVWAVEDLANRGRVHLRWVPGNHDRLLSYCLARTVAAYFRKHPRVSVDCGPASRKYHRYGSTLIGLTHGDQEKHSSLPAVMAQECPRDWAETTTREFHVGHLHRSRKLEFLSLDTHNGIPVRTLRSLSAVDAWHHRKGFVGTTRSAEAYLYSKVSGYTGHFVADVRADQAKVA